MKYNKGIDYKSLYDDYYRIHKDEFVTEAINIDLENEDYIETIKEDNDFTTVEEVKDYLSNYYNRYGCYDFFEDEIKEAVNNELEKVYNESFTKVRDLTEKFLKNLEELINIDIDLNIQESHSWSAGLFPSIYFTITLENTNNFSKLVIRLSGLHDNNRNDWDWETSWHDLNLRDYKEDLIDLLAECLTNDFNIEVEYNDFKQC